MILLVGATGALGSAIASRLLARGEQLRVLVRPGSDYAALEAAGAQPIAGDLKDPTSLADACAGARAVITTANTAARGGADTVDSVDRLGNRALIDAAREAGVEHFIFISALGAGEGSAVEFLRAKGETERYLRESGGMKHTILEPNLFMEVWIGRIVGVPLAQGDVITLVGRGDHRHAFVSRDDVAAIAAACVDNPAAADRTLVIAGADALSWIDVVHVAERIVGHTLDVRYVAPGEAMPGVPPVVAALTAALETYETVIDGRPLATEFGVRLTSVEEYLRGMRMSVPPLSA